MQANCPNCSQRIVIDDAKVPDRAFSVKCPKCQTVVRFPGKGAAPPTIAVAAAPATGTFAVPPAPGASAAVTPTAGPAAAEAPGAESGPSEEMRAQMMAQLRRELAIGEGRPAGRAMVALPDRTRAGAMALPLTRLGYQVDTVDNADEGARLLEQGVYDLVVTTRAPAAAGRESLNQRIGRLSAEGRRRIFLVLVGDEYKTSDGTQAWSVLADLVINARDVPNADAALLPTLAERTRLYQVFLDARKRQEAAAAL
jgi:predicted Zn finger-like uncharacterized protein